MSKKLDWHIIYVSVDKNNKIKPSIYNPKKSGVYLCTCIVKSGESELRYLQPMQYDSDKKYWHDVGRPHSMSHTILAWTSVDICNSNDFEYKCGYIYKKDKNNEK